jgi:hypothetical protein
VLVKSRWPFRAGQWPYVADPVRWLFLPYPDRAARVARQSSRRCHRAQRLAICQLHLTSFSLAIDRIDRLPSEKQADWDSNESLRVALWKPVNRINREN